MLKIQGHVSVSGLMTGTIEFPGTFYIVNDNERTTLIHTKHNLVELYEELETYSKTPNTIEGLIKKLEDKGIEFNIIPFEPLALKTYPPKPLKLYVWEQNNSGGYCILDKDLGIGETIVFEAASEQEAQDRFTALSKKRDDFFDYCDCCGPRWCYDVKEIVSMENENNCFRGDVYLHKIDGKLQSYTQTVEKKWNIVDIHIDRQ